jgi:ABC-2 family transporter protein
MPMKTHEYESVNSRANDLLVKNLPLFLMITYLIPLFYMVSKLAEEKEGKSREGMKMMGLKDSSYFLSWWVFNLVVIVIMASIITGMSYLNLF